ncbi:MAG: sulfotransferase [Bacteroidota bacterium]
MKTTKANLFVVGAMKAGTTSFMETLARHPNIYVSPVKEPNYFVDELPDLLYEPSRFFKLDNYFQRDFPKPLHIANVQKKEHYEQLFSPNNGEKYLAEGSTMYLHATESAQKIHQYNPEARIIILTREPVSRAYSHYKMLTGLSRETRSFQEVIEAELKERKDSTLPWYSYIEMSCYTQSVQRYKGLFEHVLVLSFEQLLNDKDLTLNRVAGFLDIDKFKNVEVAHTNKTRSLRFKWLFFLLKKIGLKDVFSAIFGSKFKRKLFNMASSSQSKPMDISEETLQELTTLFQKESQE